MQFASVRLVTADLDRLVSFYESLTGVEPTRPAPVFAEFRLGGASLAISDESLIRQFNAGAAVAASNRSAMIEFQVDDVDALHEQAKSLDADIVMPPSDMPWGNRSMLLRDPDGNVVNIFVRGRRDSRQRPGE
ncbi:MAG TPA: VOC family protein [Devosia sp.]|jgi:uncharacterized glyoxalase superfamily protein PhnB|nr:VOC family protein [Devosia sp.]